MSKTIAIIPARGGSKRLPGKNLMLLGKIPLIAHSILYAQKHTFIDAVYISTDDELIKKTALEYGAIVIDRPKELSGDLEPTVSALKHVLQTIENEVENVILLQVTNPLRPENLLEEAFSIFQAFKLINTEYFPASLVYSRPFKPQVSFTLSPSLNSLIKSVLSCVNSTT